MATYTGSGAFIAIAAGEQDFFGDMLSGITVGRGTTVYCKIAPIYKKTSSGSITTSALNIFSDIDDTELDNIILDEEPSEEEWDPDDPLLIDEVDESGEYLEFKNPLNVDLSKVTRLRIRGRTPYTGYVQCLYNVKMYDVFGTIDSASWTQIYFDKGFLNWPNSRVIG